MDETRRVVRVKSCRVRPPGSGGGREDGGGGVEGGRGEDEKTQQLRARSKWAWINVTTVKSHQREQGGRKGGEDG